LLKRVIELKTASRLRLAESRKTFEDDHASWEQSCEDIRKRNDARLKEYEINLQRWKKDKATFLEKQTASDAEVDGRRSAYL